MHLDNGSILKCSNRSRGHYSKNAPCFRNIIWEVLQNNEEGNTHTHTHTHTGKQSNNSHTYIICPPPGDLPNPGIEPRSPALQEDSLQSEPPGKPLYYILTYIPDGLKN